MAVRKVKEMYNKLYLGFTNNRVHLADNFFVLEWLFIDLLRKSVENLSYWANIANRIWRNIRNKSLYDPSHLLYICTVFLWNQCVRTLQWRSLLIKARCLSTTIERALSSSPHSHPRNIFPFDLQYQRTDYNQVYKCLVKVNLRCYQNSHHLDSGDHCNCDNRKGAVELSMGIDIGRSNSFASSRIHYPHCWKSHLQSDHSSSLLCSKGWVWYLHDYRIKKDKIW